MSNEEILDKNQEDAATENETGADVSGDAPADGETPSVEELTERLVLAEKKASREQYEKEMHKYEAQLKFILDPSSIPAAGSGVLHWPFEASYMLDCPSYKTYLGNYQPDFTAGFSNSFRFKNGLGISFLIDGRFGGELYSGTDASMDAAGVTERTLEYRDGVKLDAVVNTGTPEAPVYEPNQNTITGEQYWGAMNRIADYHVYSQTNIRLREFAITYNFPSKMFENSLIDKVSVGLIGRNLFFFYKDIENFDPESSFSTSNFSQGVLWYNLPTTKSFGFSLNINF